MPSFPPATKIVRFGLFELNLHAGELRKNGLKLKLLGQPLQILTILVRHRGEVVSREQLRAELWPTGTFVDFDHGLNNSIQKIREVLDDSAANPRFIETVPRRGYRFLPSVEVGFEPIDISPHGGVRGDFNHGTGRQSLGSKAETVEAESTRVLLPTQRAGLIWLAVVALAIIAALLYILEFPKQAAMIHSLIAPPEKAGFSSVTGYNIGLPVISPDGKNLAFAAKVVDNTSMIWIRPLGSLQARPLLGTEHGYGPFWSPDSKSIAFFSLGKLMTVGLYGNTPLALCDVPGGGRGGSWGADGTILFVPGPRAGIFRVSAKGGTAAAVTKIDESRHGSHRWPFMLPDGSHFLYLAVNFRVPLHENDGIYYASLDGRENRLLLKTHSNAEYASGYLLFVRDGLLLAQPFDPSTGRFNGEHQRVAENVAEDATTWHGTFSASAGTLTYAPAEAIHDAQLTWFDRSGRQLGNMSAGLKGQLYQPFLLSPQGDRIAAGVDMGVTDVWVLDPSRATHTRLTFQENSVTPVWSPSGKEIAFLSYTGRWNIFRKASDGTGEEKKLLESADATWPLAWCPNSTCLLYAQKEQGVFQLWTIPFEGLGPRVHIATGGDFAAATFSPNGRWVAYTSNETGKPEIYIVPFDRGAGKWQVSNGGGSSRPVWPKNTNEIFYLTPDHMLTAVSVKESAGSLQIGVPRPLFRVPGSGYFDVPARGRKILIGIVGVPNPNPVHLVANWSAELKR